jgi:hypothetical protein
VPHQTAELTSALAKGRITKRLFNHPAIKPKTEPEPIPTSSY